MFKSIGNLFRALIYLLTGRIDQARKTLMSNPNVIQANYEEIINEKKNRLKVYQGALSGLIATQETKMAKLKDQSGQANHYESLKAGAAGQAQGIVKQIGNNPEAVRENTEYQKCQAAYRDFSSTLDEKQKMIAELEGDIKNLGKQISGHQNNINGLLREIDRLKSEKHEAVADIVSAKQEKEIADMLSGISEDKTSKELQELREVRTQAKAAARVSREVAGVTAKQTEDEFLGFATNSKVDNEFEKMVGLSHVTNENLEQVIQATEAAKTKNV